MKQNRIIFRIAEILLLLVFSAALIFAGFRLTTVWYEKDIMETLDDTFETIKESEDLYVAEEKNYEDLCRSIARISAQYLAGENIEKYTLYNLSNMIGAKGVAVINTKGELISGTEDNPSWLSDDTFQSFIQNVDLTETIPTYVLEDIVPTEENTEGEDLGTATESKMMYEEGKPYDFLCFAKLESDDGEERILVIRDNTEDFTKLNFGIGDFNAILGKNFRGDKEKYLLATENGIILSSSQFQEGETKATKISDLGLTDACLRNDYSGTVRINGVNYFCKTSASEDYGIMFYLIYFIPRSVLWQATIFVLAGEFAAVLFSVLLIRITFRMIDSTYFAQRRRRDPHRVFGRRTRLSAVAAMCCILTAAVTIFGNMLYYYSEQTRQCMGQARDLAADIDNLEDNQEFSSVIYEHYMSKVDRVLAALVSANPALRSKENLKQLAKEIKVEHILIYDQNGVVTNSSHYYNGLSISDDRQKMSNEFRWLLYGKDVLVQKEADPDFLDEPHYYSGAPLVGYGPDGDRVYDGFLQTAVSVAFHDDLVKVASMKSILSTNSIGRNQIVFAVDHETERITSPASSYDTLTAGDAGIPESFLRDGFTGFLRLNHREMIGCSAASDRFTVINFSDTTETPLIGLKNGLYLSAYGVAAEMLYFLLCYFIARKNATEEVVASSVRGNKELEEQVEKDMIQFCFRYLYLISACMTLVKIFSVVWLDEQSAPYYVFVTQWAKGFHIYSITTCMIYFFIAVFLLSSMTHIGDLLCSIFSPRQETIMRMTLSFTKYIVVLGAIIICADTLGAPTSSLLAVSGIATLMFSVGSQSLVADIISGLFIIFEGTYKVGDMITVDKWHGQVIEIGIRNTKIRDLIESNVKIINNSTIRNIINYSEYPSKCSTRISVDYAQNIDEIEAIFEKEKDTIMKNLPPLEGDIVLLGLDQFQDSTIVLEFQVLCRNEIYPIVRRALNQEIKEMFDRNGITVPLPQVVLSERNAEISQKKEEAPAEEKEKPEAEPIKQENGEADQK